MSIAYVGDTIRITVTFRSWSDNTETGTPENPVSVVSVATNTSLSTPASETLTSIHTGEIGEYYIDWTPGLEGDYTVSFTATFVDDSVDIIEQEFTVYEQNDTIPDSIDLGEDVVILFAAGLNPLYLDPEELAVIYPDAPLLDMAEQIHVFSLEVKTALGLGDTEVPDAKWIEYIKAAAACSLSKVFDYTTGGDELSFRLGDLSITNRNSGKSTLTRANAGTWCELAAVLRRELYATQAGLVPAVKAIRRRNPMPPRRLKKF